MPNYKKLKQLTALCTLAVCLFIGSSNFTSSDTSKNNEASTENVTTTEEVKAYKEQLGEDADTSKNKIVLDNMGYSRLVFTLKKDKVVSVCMELL